MSFESHLQAIPYREEKVGNAIDQIFFLGGGGWGKGQWSLFSAKIDFFYKGRFRDFEFCL